MKKILTLILVALMVTPSFAQFETSRKRSRYNHNDTERYYGLRLGVNSATLNSSDVFMDMNARAGLAFGAVYGMQLANSTPLWLEAGLFYSEKGGKNYVADTGIDIKCRLTYLEIPVVVKYGFDLADDFYLQPFLGGFFAVGVGGKTKDYVTRESYSSYHHVNRMDAGIRLGCGIEYQMVYAEAGFDFGLANIGKDDFDSVRTQTLFFNIGVNF